MAVAKEAWTYLYLKMGQISEKSNWMQILQNPILYYRESKMKDRDRDLHEIGTLWIFFVFCFFGWELEEEHSQHPLLYLCPMIHVNWLYSWKSPGISTSFKIFICIEKLGTPSPFVFTLKKLTLTFRERISYVESKFIYTNFKVHPYM